MSDLRPRAARFLAMPVVYCVLLIAVLMAAAAGDASRALAQGTYGVGGYLVRPEQDIVNDPSSIDPNVTDNSRELLKRKQQMRTQQQAQPETQQRNRATQERERTNRRQRSQERAEEAPRNRQQRAARANRGRGTEKESSSNGGEGTQEPQQNATQPATGTAAQQGAGDAPESATAAPPAVSETEKAATSGAPNESAEKAAAEKIEAEKAAAEKAVEEKATAEKAAAEKVVAEKAAAEKAAAEIAASLTNGGKSAAESASASQSAAGGAGERAAAVSAASVALTETVTVLRNGERAATGSISVVNAAGIAARNAVALQHAGKLGSEAAALPEPQEKVTGATPATAESADPLDKMIGQMLMVGFEGTTPDETSVQRLAAQIKSGQVGGVLYLGRNIVSPQQVTTLNAYLRRANPDVPVLLAIDQEGGVVQRLSHDKGFPEFPSAGQVGEGNDPLIAYAVYERMATQLASYGFNLNLGPVVDLQRSKSAVIAGQERSFGENPRAVAAFAKAFCIAHRTVGLLTALKHFPGHGSTEADTHNGDADVSETWKSDELDPYRELIGAGAADMVMTGHIAHRDWSDEKGLPASLSEKAAAKLLRGELGFAGVIITDDLEMGAVSKRLSPEESVIRAIKAGNNIVMLSNKAKPSLDLPERMIAAIRKAVQNGDLKPEQIEQSYEHILALKQKLHGQNAKLSAKHDDAAGKSAPAR